MFGPSSGNSNSKFSFQSNGLLRFKEEFKNGMIITWNALHKLSIVIVGITQKPLWIRAFKMAKWQIAKERKFWTHLTTWEETGN